MRKVVIVIFLLGITGSTYAQTFNEWFRQSRTQIKYLVNQIAALQIYIEFAQKGYKIVDQGLTLIGDIKRGDFNLHNDFFNSLKAINPKIRNSVEVARIIELQVQLTRSQKNAIKKIRQTEYLTANEIEYLVGVYNRLLEQSLDNIEELFTLLTADEYELSDDERIKRINLLHTDMQDKHQFIQWFTGETEVLMASRRKETRDVKVVESFTQEK